MIRLSLVVTALVVLMSGCGGSGEQAAGGPLPPPGAGSDNFEIGPLVVRTEKTGNFQAVDIPSASGCAFVALYGAQINYLASTALLDRVIFSSNRAGAENIYICNLDGSGLLQVTSNTAREYSPRWSPDGTKIVFARQWPTQYAVICTINANGTGAAVLTSNTTHSVHPDWSPNGGWIAYGNYAGGIWDVWAMYTDGTSQTNVTDQMYSDMYPAWSPDGNSLVFSTTRYGGGAEIATMPFYGTTATRLTNDNYVDVAPAWAPAPVGTLIAYSSQRHSNDEIFVMGTSGAAQRNLTNNRANDIYPRWSTDGSFIAFTSTRSGNPDIWIMDFSNPRRNWQVTNHPGDDFSPDLGSPTMQTDRVLIGGSGSDRGADPVYPSAPAVIAAFDQDGYRNLVRIGVANAHLPSMRVRPLAISANGIIGGTPAPPGVEVSATKVANLREDAGWGTPATLWDFNALDAGMVLLYFNSDTGKLAAAVPVKDVVYPTAAGSAQPVYTSSVHGDGLLLTGDLLGVFDAEGRNLAPGGAHSVKLSRAGEVLAVN